MNQEEGILKLKNLRAMLIGTLLVSGIGSLQAQNTLPEFYTLLLDFTPGVGGLHNGLTTLPILSLPMGGEQQAMAGAYTAVAKDLSFLEANPAAAPLQDETAIALFHTNIIDDINLQTLGYSQRWGDFGIGAMIKFMSTSFRANNMQNQQVASASYTEAVIGLNAAYTFFRNYDFSGIAVGTSLKLGFRNMPAILYQAVTGLNGLDQSMVGFMADIGALTRFNFLKAYSSRDQNFSIGLSVRNLGPPVQGDALPTLFTSGIAYQPFRFLTISGDLDIPMNLVDLSKSSDPGFSVGVNLQFVNFLSIKGGFQLLYDAPSFSVGADLKLNGVAFAFNYSVNYSTTFKIPDHMALQLRISLGDDGRKALREKADNLYIDAINALAESDYAKVIELCQQVLELDKTFQPARDMLELAKSSQAVINNINSIHLDANQ